MAEAREQLQKLPFAKGLQNVFTDSRYSDLEVVCKDRSWKVHKLVVCTQSDFFKKACDGNFAEAQENRISLPDDDPEVVDVLFHYFYHFDYCEERRRGMHPLLLNMYLLSLADKYFVEPLKEIATARFRCRAYTDWESDGFAETLEKLYEPELYVAPMEVLRGFMLEAVEQHHNKLFHDEAHSRFRNAAVSSPDFMLLYIQNATREPSVPSNVPDTQNMFWFRCPCFQCRNHKSILGVRNTIQPSFTLSCPMGCIVNQNLKFWNRFKVNVGT